MEDNKIVLLQYFWPGSIHYLFLRCYEICTRCFYFYFQFVTSMVCFDQYYKLNDIINCVIHDKEEKATFDMNKSIVNKIYLI